MEGRSKIWVKRFTGVSLFLIIIFVASWSQSTESIVEKMDVDENHIIKLESGEQGSLELSKIGYYIAFRFNENGSQIEPELRMTDMEGNNIEGREPGLIESNNKRPNASGKIVYIPVRVFEIQNDAEYILINDGNTTLWLIDELDIQASLFSDWWVVVSMISCFLGFPMAIITLIVGLILWRRKDKSPEKEIIIQQNIMTTDELFKKHNSIEGNQVANPFTKNESSLPELTAEDKLEDIDIENSDKKETESQREESENNWKNWDEG